MPWLKLCNNFLRKRSNENRKKYLKQRNYCVSLKKIKRNYNSNVNEKNITDNKNFRKTATPFLPDKVLSTKKKQFY